MVRAVYVSIRRCATTRAHARAVRPIDIGPDPPPWSRGAAGGRPATGHQWSRGLMAPRLVRVAWWPGGPAARRLVRPATWHA